MNRDSIIYSKTDLREQYKRKRVEFFNSSELSSSLSALHSYLDTLLSEEFKTIQSNFNVASYKSFGTEVNLEQFQMENVNFCYPRVHKEGIKLHRPHQCEDSPFPQTGHLKEEEGNLGFIKNKWGIEEPVVESSQSISVEDCKAVLIPGLAFTRDGERLGYGRGYYDQLLENYQGLKVGVAFSVQVTFDTWELYGTDVAMDYIVTEKYILKTHV